MLFYNKCLEEEPMYKPRKFQNDKVYTINDQEKNVYNKLALKKLKTKMETLINRWNIFETVLIPFEKETEQFIDNKKEYVKFQRYHCLQDIWKKKIEGNKKRNEESNISNRKGNSNNINEERRDTPNPRRHNLGNYNNYRSRN